jgi:uncharacterized HAD superfamily protein
MIQRIGIDIDGVLGDHRTGFVALLQRTSGKTCDANAIVRIPVRNNPQLGVTQEDETRVFNRPEYWSEMPVYHGAAETIRNLRSIGWRVYVFTRRPWPDMDRLDANALSAWEQFLPETLRSLPAGKVRKSITRWLLDNGTLIRRVTRAWLRSNSLEWDRLVVERARMSAGISQDERDRFSVARSDSLFVFVEDEPPKAIRLAESCEQVLLFNQPYNLETETKLPTNVRRVDSWAEIADVLLRRSR